MNGLRSLTKKKLEPLTTEQWIDLLKSTGKGIMDLAKSNKIAGYTLTSLAILGLGKANLLSCGVVGTLQGVNTYIAISEMVEEDVDSGFFGLGGTGETIAKGMTSLGIGALWGFECESGKQKYSNVARGDVKSNYTGKDIVKDTAALTPARGVSDIFFGIGEVFGVGD